MIVECLIAWITANITKKVFGFLVENIFSKEFVKDLVKDYAKDFFKFIVKTTLTAGFKQEEALQKAKVMALAEFVQLMEEDLIYGGFSKDNIKDYSQSIKHFIDSSKVKQILGSAFKHDCQAIDTNELQERWNHNLNPSDPFNWKTIGKKYLEKVKEIILEMCR